MFHIYLILFTFIHQTKSFNIGLLIFLSPNIRGPNSGGGQHHHLENLIKDRQLTQQQNNLRVDENINHGHSNNQQQEEAVTVNNNIFDEGENSIENMLHHSLDFGVDDVNFVSESNSVYEDSLSHHRSQLHQNIINRASADGQLANVEQVLLRRTKRDFISQRTNQHSDQQEVIETRNQHRYRIRFRAKLANFFISLWSGLRAVNGTTAHGGQIEGEQQLDQDKLEQDFNFLHVSPHSLSSMGSQHLLTVISSNNNKNNNLIPKHLPPLEPYIFRAFQFEHLKPHSK